MIKGAMVLVFFAGAVLVGGYYFGGVSSFDPAKSASDTRAAIKPGMTWDEVLAVGAPHDIRHLAMFEKSIAGEIVEEVAASPTMVRFSEERFREEMANNENSYGFIFEYQFGGIRFGVHFDAGGVVESLADRGGTRDLLGIP